MRFKPFDLHVNLTSSERYQNAAREGTLGRRLDLRWLTVGAKLPQLRGAVDPGAPARRVALPVTAATTTTATATATATATVTATATATSSGVPTASVSSAAAAHSLTYWQAIVERESHPEARDYRKARIPLLQPSPKFCAKYPSVPAYAATGEIVVRSDEGRFQRFPPDRGNQLPVHSFAHPEYPGEAIGRTQARQLNEIYDGRLETVRETVAEYSYDPVARTLSFEVGGNAVGSIALKFPIYALPGRKWMLPQQDIMDCSYAVEEMLLAEGKASLQVYEQLADYRPVGNRRSFEDMEKSLNRRGATTSVLKGDSFSPKETMAALRAGLQDHGPCAFGYGAHERIIDSVEDDPEGLLVQVRDPMPGSVRKVVADDRMFQTGYAGGKKWTALFVTNRAELR
jgi:hypothetical protein